MPRINLSISDELYEQLQKAAGRENVTVNYIICETLEEKFGKGTVYDYKLALASMIEEAKTMETDFTLSDLPTFAGVNDVLDEYEINESPAQVRARLGKMFNESVRSGAVEGIERAVVERNGAMELKFHSRAAVYTNRLPE